MSIRTFESRISGNQKVYISVDDDKTRPIDGIYGKRVSYTKGHTMIKGNLFHSAKEIAPNIMSRW